jgi:hypothetical protein
MYSGDILPPGMKIINTSAPPAVCVPLALKHLPVTHQRYLQHIHSRTASFFVYPFTLHTHKTNNLMTSILINFCSLRKMVKQKSML